jgi:internalin A
MVQKSLSALKSSLEKQYPGYNNSFNPPATEDDLLAYEQLIGKPLPEDYKELYRSHNGQQRFEKYGLAFFFSLPFISIQESMEQWKSSRQIDYGVFLDAKSHSIPADHIREQYMHPAWIPISRDSGGNYIGVDLDPDGKGTYGQVINFGRDEETKYVMATGIGEFLAYMLDLIQKDRLVILDEEDDDADEEEDDDGNVLPLPRVHRFAIDGNVIWHFLDWLKVLDLPGKPVLSEEERDYSRWLNSAPAEWKALTEATCNNDIGFTHPSEAVRFYPRSLPVPDLAYIHHFSNLREVILSGVAFTDISALKSLPWLKILYLSGSRATDLGVLRDMKRLRELNINRLDVADFTPLQDLALHSLALEASSIKDLSPIAKIKTLRTLDISNTAVSDGAQLAHLKELRALKMFSTGITDLSFLDQLEALQELGIDGLSTSSCEPLFKLKTITRLTASFAVAREMRKHWTHQVQYTIRGEMSEEEEQEWLRFH